LPPGDSRQFAGEVILIEDVGLSVISDIDDTIKVTQVRDRRATLRNTFVRPFEPAPGMAELYQNLVRSNRSELHYVSASPWQLYLPLVEFVRTNGFPPGSFALKEFRWKDRSFVSLFADPEKYKPAIIEPLLKRFPNRQFLLIGDSGERDPEIYAALARKYPEQIIGIWIRDVTNEPSSAARYQEIFRTFPRGLWQVFKSPSELIPLSNTPIRSH
jgi:phosphatidate phosphatase APP1